MCICYFCVNNRFFLKGGDASIYPLNDQSQKGTAASTQNVSPNATTTNVTTQTTTTTSTTETTTKSTPNKDDSSSVPPEVNKRLVDEIDSNTEDTKVKKFKLDNNKVISITLKEDDIQRTGAKCVKGEQSDSVQFIINDSVLYPSIT